MLSNSLFNLYLYIILLLFSSSFEMANMQQHIGSIRSPPPQIDYDIPVFLYLHICLFSVSVGCVFRAVYLFCEFIRYALFPNGLSKPTKREEEYNVITNDDEYSVANVATESLLSDSIHVNEYWHVVVMPSGSGKRYVIGLVLEAVDETGDIMLSVDLLLLDCGLFFRFPMERAKLHLAAAAEDDECVLLADDMRVLLGLQENTLNNVCVLPMSIKTHWIRLIQRKWRKVFQEKMVRLRRRGSLMAQRRFELCGNYGGDDVGFRGLNGMLSSLFQSKKI